MNIKFKIYLINFIPSIPVKKKIEDKIVNLNRIEKNISGCRIIIESSYDEELSKYFYVVKINLTLNGKIIITNRYSNSLSKYEDIHVAVWRAFITIRQQLDNFYKSQRQYDINKSNIQSYGCTMKLIQTNNIYLLKAPNHYYQS